MRRTFQSRYGIIEDRQILREIGEGYSNGSYYALKIKYHHDPKRWLAQSEGLIGTSSIQKNKEKSPKNELGIEVLGAGFYGSVYYQRQLYSEENLRLVIKQGFLYVPEFEEKGFVSGPADDIKPMGFYIPTSLLAVIGPRKFSLQLGVANLFHYGPLRYPIPLGQTYALERAQFLITGVKSQIGRITLYGQFNLSFDFRSENVIATNVGFGAGYVF